MPTAGLAIAPLPDWQLSHTMTEAVTAKADQIRLYGLQTAQRLRYAASLANEDNKPVLTALAHRLALCNQHRNTWIATDLHNQDTGEMFDGFGRYWQCNSKLCAFCVRDNARRNRRTLRDAVARQKLFVGEHYRLITLTVPNLGLDIPTTRSLVNRAWSLLRKRLWFKRSVVGGAKAEEFTKTRNGFHYHLHVLGRTRYIAAEHLRQEWTDAVRTAFAEADQPFEVHTSDGLLIANLKIVHDLHQVANEVCKYITKSNTWSSIPLDALTHVALVPQWHRMFEVFGTFRNLTEKATPERTRYLSDADGNVSLFTYDSDPPEPRNHWRILITQMPLEKYIARLENEFAETVRRRTEIMQLKFPWATITTLEDP